MPDARFPVCFLEAALTELPTASCLCHVLCSRDTGVTRARVPQLPVRTLESLAHFSISAVILSGLLLCHSGFHLHLAYSLKFLNH